MMPGVLAGSAPLLGGLFQCARPGSCSGATCWSLCIPLAAAAGVLAGAWLVASSSSRRTLHIRQLLLAAAIGATAMAAGRPAVLVGGIVGLVLGMTMALMAFRVRRRPFRE